MTNDRNPLPLRTVLFVAASDAHRVAKALASDADAVILDLEDAVAEQSKPAARRTARGSLEQAGERGGLWIRVNAVSTPHCLADLEAVTHAGLVAIVLPKAETIAAIAAVDWVVTQYEQQRALQPGAIDLVPLIESARGLAAAQAIAGAASRVRRLAFGAADFIRDLGLRSTPDDPGLDYARHALVVASRAAGRDPPLDAPSLDWHDPARIEAVARRSRSMGFQGKLCIHPAQIEPCRRAFAPTPAELARAERIVTRFAEAERAGVGAIEVDGTLVDRALAASAQQLLDSRRA
jgi:citrate lyase subunit beta/citryl-CoA lyase